MLLDSILTLCVRDQHQIHSDLCLSVGLLTPVSKNKLQAAVTCSEAAAKSAAKKVSLEEPGTKTVYC